MPDHAPEAVQLVAFVLLQVSVELPPLTTTVGLADNVIVGGAGALATATETELWISPPAPLQMSEYELGADKAPVDSEPLLALVPDQAPLAVHCVAFAADHDRVLAAPVATLSGFAVNDKVGAAGGAVTVTVTDRVIEPPAPVHVRL